MSDSASKEARRTGRSTESIRTPIRARLAALGSDERVQRWRWVAFPFTLWAVTRVAILGFGRLSMTFVPDLVQSAGLHREYLLGHTSIEGLCRWDCRYFQELANHGYLHEGYTNFFPLYPLRRLGVAGVHRPHHGTTNAFPRHWRGRLSFTAFRRRDAQDFRRRAMFDTELTGFGEFARRSAPSVSDALPGGLGLVGLPVVVGQLQPTRGRAVQQHRHVRVML